MSKMQLQNYQKIFEHKEFSYTTHENEVEGSNPSIDVVGSVRTFVRQEEKESNPPKLEFKLNETISKKSGKQIKPKENLDENLESEETPPDKVDSDRLYPTLQNNFNPTRVDPPPNSTIYNIYYPPPMSYVPIVPPEPPFYHSTAPSALPEDAFDLPGPTFHAQSWNEQSCCAICNSTTHRSVMCNNKSATIRKSIANVRELCPVCLIPGHGVSRCPNDSRCRLCNERHSHVICVRAK